MSKQYTLLNSLTQINYNASFRISNLDRHKPELDLFFQRGLLLQGLIRNKRNINYGKTKVIGFNLNSRCDNASLSNVVVGDIELTPSLVNHFLGLVIDFKLNF